MFRIEESNDLRNELNISLSTNKILDFCLTKNNDTIFICIISFPLDSSEFKIVVEIFEYKINKLDNKLKKEYNCKTFAIFQLYCEEINDFTTSILVHVI